jgi:hypothetical protein
VHRLQEVQLLLLRLLQAPVGRCQLTFCSGEMRKPWFFFLADKNALMPFPGETVFIAASR